ncbi:MAG: RbsD/FucU family protein [Alphaproteobacteria bacterium]
MLKGISPRLDSAILTMLNDMGHGDRLIITDTHFPAFSTHHNVANASGSSVNELLEAILPLFELDEYIKDSVIMMSPVQGDTHDPQLIDSYANILNPHFPKGQKIHFVDRFKFYDISRQSYGIIISSDTRKYANIILTKGVTPSVQG